MGKYTVIVSSEAKKHLELYYKSGNKIIINPHYSSRGIKNWV